MKQGRLAAAPIAIMLCLSLRLSLGAQAVSTQELNALVAFRTNMVKDPRHTLSSWDGSDPCGLGPSPRWEGVICDDAVSVVGLSLTWVNLSGILPPEIGDLVNLQTLDLTGNWLIGPIPDSISRLTKLVRFSVAFNRNDLEHPDDEFDFSNPDFHGLNGTIPAGLSQLQLLQVLALNNNKLAGSIPAELGSLKQLQVLSLGANQLSGPLPVELCSLGPQLTMFSVSSNKLYGSIPWELSNLTGLQQLNLGVNRFAGGIPADLGNLVHLELLDVRSNLLTGAIPASLGRLPALKWLHLEGNRLSGRIPAELGNCSNLAYIFASDNQLEDSIPEALGDLVNLLKVQLNNNSITGSIPHSLASLPDLTRLDLSDNQLSGRIPDNWGEGCRLETLLLRDNGLQGPLPASLSNCVALILVDIRNNQLEGSIPKEYQEIIKLRVLVLSNNSLNGSIPDSIARLSRLQVLALPSNSLEGVIPRNLSGLSAFQQSGSLDDGSVTTLYEEVLLEAKGVSLTYEYILKTNTFFDLSSNQLSNTIPPDMGDYLVSMRVFNLSHNFLEGEIPSSLHSLSAVESMDLSYNRLSGNIPASLTELNFLTTFRVTDNRLSGPIPTGGQFSTFQASDFLGNDQLCGAPLKVKCSIVPAAPRSQPVYVDAGDDSVVSFTALCIGLAAGFIGVTMAIYTNKWARSYVFRTGAYTYEPAVYIAQHGLYKPPNVWTQ